MHSSGTAYAVRSLPSTVISDTGNHPRDALFRHRLCSFRLPSTVTIIRGMSLSTARAVIGLADTGNHPRDALFRACAIFSLSSTVISDMGNHPRDTLFRHHLCSRQSIEYGYNHPRNALFYCLCSGQSIRYGQSSKRCALPAPFVQSSVYQVRLQQSSEGCLLLLLVQLSVY